VSELLKTFDIFGRKEYVSGGNDQASTFVR